ncbi:hypothetical protein EMIHUDRAFT_207347 [Emiliania huxleyi CCMP1516]|uniref:SET domain-containing protein n=2 Tax=Emiliania huxleyi TaxID=2903 RepID=A0A0D3JFB8_EMIH1|nr:hypothetical protein EMIHUDRAFT_207347 [Emiliania huxleyi CCMP1516]EOD22203.1 hypothetical protein EMIHUDRAFT_207347 [Emiliania huxleyi CCMP1516]|eukprot:XP_005774632.1 hypothetical protein EMIHUDRAFT_207347 [Emiliania huxleyi CCMP1516]
MNCIILSRLRVRGDGAIPLHIMRPALSGRRGALARHCTSLTPNPSPRPPEPSLLELDVALCNPLPTRLARSSVAPEAGLGVFAAEPVVRGRICSFYPGTIWRLEDLWLATPIDDSQMPLPSLSVSNSYLLRCTVCDEAGSRVDCLVDGRPWGESAAIFGRLAAALGPGRVYTGWLEGPVRRTDLARLATASAASSHALGHLLNHSDRQANVVFAPPVPVEERQLSPAALSRVPVVAAASLTTSLGFPGWARALAFPRWLLPIRAARDIEEGEELLWSYGQDPLEVGWRK